MPYNINAWERIAGRVAIQQALFWHFRMGIPEIAALLDSNYFAVYRAVSPSSSQVRGWHRRTHKAEAIAAARKLLAGVP